MKNTIFIFCLIITVLFTCSCSKKAVSEFSETTAQATTAQPTTVPQTTAEPTTIVPTTEAKKEIAAVDYLGKTKNEITGIFGTDYEIANMFESGRTEFFYYPDDDVPYIFGILPNTDIVQCIYLYNNDKLPVKVYGEIYSNMKSSDLLSLKGYNFEKNYMEMDNTNTISFSAGDYDFLFTWYGDSNSSPADKVMVASTDIQVAEYNESNSNNDNNDDKQPPADSDIEISKQFLCSHIWNLKFATDKNGENKNIRMLYGSMMSTTGAKIVFNEDGSFNAAFGMEGGFGTYSVENNKIIINVDTLYTGSGNKAAGYDYETKYTQNYNQESGEYEKSIGILFGDYIDYFVAKQ